MQKGLNTKKFDSKLELQNNTIHLRDNIFFSENSNTYLIGEKSASLVKKDEIKNIVKYPLFFVSDENRITELCDLTKDICSDVSVVSESDGIGKGSKSYVNFFIKLEKIDKNLYNYLSGKFPNMKLAFLGGIDDTMKVRRELNDLLLREGHIDMKGAIMERVSKELFSKKDELVDELLEGYGVYELNNCEMSEYVNLQNYLYCIPNDYRVKYSKEIGDLIITVEFIYDISNNQFVVLEVSSEDNGDIYEVDFDRNECLEVIQSFIKNEMKKSQFIDDFASKLEGSAFEKQKNYAFKKELREKLEEYKRI